jgi:hypothetical protein
MIPGSSFNTNNIFSGGSGIFLQHHDIIRPTYLSAIIKILFDNKSYGLPIDIIRNMSIVSLLEWYVTRRYFNPLRSLDYKHIIPPEELDELLLKILNSDNTIYTLSPLLNIRLMLNIYKKHSMNFPVYIYTKEEEPFLTNDNFTEGIPVTYVHGDLQEAINKCDQNYTYIFSDINILKEASEMLSDNFSHLLLAREYRYNYISKGVFKHDLVAITKKHNHIRVGLTYSMSPKDVLRSLLYTLKGGSNDVKTSISKTY